MTFIGTARARLRTMADRAKVRADPCIIAIAAQFVHLLPVTIIPPVVIVGRAICARRANDAMLVRPAPAFARFAFTLFGAVVFAAKRITFMAGRG